MEEPEKTIIARTRTSGVTFTPPVTHDMVRSLFDPTVKKSFLELCISASVVLNVLICYWIYRNFGLGYAKNAFLLQYVFWRISYNLGIGLLLHYQSHYESVVNYAKESGLFDKRNTSWLARFCQFEIKTKMDIDFEMSKYPVELNAWLLFRQFVDLVLMQDFWCYLIFVALSAPRQISAYVSWTSAIGFLMVIFNIWVKLDAHRVVKDYAWYWGDFFFLQDAELTFDGVFNISPHPMYSIGYLGYYGLSIICGDYKVLLVSVFGHVLQFLFLKHVETPHIERTYGTESDDIDNGYIDDLIAKENDDYTRPLINNGILFENFNKLRFTDYFSLGTIALIFSAYWVPAFADNNLLFYLTFLSRLITWSVIAGILYKQSKDKWFTKLYLRNGHTQVYSYQQWQFLYNYSHVLTYSLLVVQTAMKISEMYPEINYTQVIFGFIAIAIQIWCNTEMRSAISDFGWFYGDFFLNNFITSRKLTSQGIYRYLNNPEAIFGVAGVWGTVLMTGFCYENIVLSVFWTFTNFLLIKYVESPHVAKFYGDLDRVSGVEKTLLGITPLKKMSDFVGSFEQTLSNTLLESQRMEKGISVSQTDTSKLKTKLEIAVDVAVNGMVSKVKPFCTFSIDGDVKEGDFILPTPIAVSWKLPIAVYNDDDWIGMYRVIDTKGTREVTRISTLGHWSATNPSGYAKGPNTLSVTEFEKSEAYVKGKVVFDSSLLYYTPGIYEFRYHSKNSHNVVMISCPIQLEFPIFDPSSPTRLGKQLIEFLSSIGVVKDRHFDSEGNKYFNTKRLSSLIKYSLGVDISVDYIVKVNGDIDVIAHRICDIKRILDSLA